MRAADIRKFPWNRYDGERVQIRSQKTGKLVWIPATRELRAHLDGLTRTGGLAQRRGQGGTVEHKCATCAGGLKTCWTKPPGTAAPQLWGL